MVSMNPTQLVIAASIIFFTRCLYLRYLHPLSNYPGPFLASCTTFWRLFTFYTGQQHIVDHELHQKYGPVVRIGPNSLLFSDVSAFESIYGFNKSIQKGDFYCMVGHHDPEKANIFAARTDKQHRERSRKIVSTALTLKHVTSYEPIISKNLTVFLERLRSVTDSTSSTINVAPYIRRFTFDTLFELVYGVSMDYQSAKNDDTIAAQQELAKMALGLPLVPWLGNLLSSPYISSLIRRPTTDKNGSPTGFTKVIEKVTKAIAGDVDGSEHRDTILQNLRRITEDDSRRMEGEEIWSECLSTSTTMRYQLPANELHLDLNFAGLSSTAAALTAILYEIGTHPDAQHRLYEEVRALGPNKAASSSLLDCIIKESLRLSPPFPSVFPRYIRSGAENLIPNLSTSLPAGTMVGCNVYVHGRSKEIWGDDADEWIPERWMHNSDAGGVKAERKTPRDYAAFGRGSRACKGKDIAWILLSKAVAEVCSNWEIVARPGSLKGRNAFEMQYDESMVELRRRHEGMDRRNR